MILIVALIFPMTTVSHSYFPSLSAVSPHCPDCVLSCRTFYRDETVTIILKLYDFYADVKAFKKSPEKGRRDEFIKVFRNMFCQEKREKESWMYLWMMTLRGILRDQGSVHVLKPKEKAQVAHL